MDRGAGRRPGRERAEPTAVPRATPPRPARHSGSARLARALTRSAAPKVMSRQASRPSSTRWCPGRLPGGDRRARRRSALTTAARCWPSEPRRCSDPCRDAGPRNHGHDADRSCRGSGTGARDARRRDGLDEDQLRSRRRAAVARDARQPPPRRGQDATQSTRCRRSAWARSFAPDRSAPQPTSDRKGDYLRLRVGDRLLLTRDPQANTSGAADPTPRSDRMLARRGVRGHSPRPSRVAR